MELEHAEMKSSNKPKHQHSDNFKYCVMFLKNSGERIRAIRLVMDAASINSKEAAQWVDGLSFKPYHDERRKREQERLRHMEKHSTDIYG